MNKKLLALLLLIAAMFLFAACREDEDPAPDVGAGDYEAYTEPGDDMPPTDGAAAAFEMPSNVRLIMATGGVAGTYYPLGGAMASVINNYTDIHVSITSSGASADNVQQIGLGDAHVAIVQNDVMYYAFTGTSIWEGQPPVTNMATLMSLYPETIHIVTLADSGIYSVSDLVGQRVSVGALGSGVAANASQVLAAYGLTIDDLNVFHLNFADSASAMQDFNLDAFFVTAATPNTAVRELSHNRDLRIVPLSEEGINSLMSDYNFYVRVEVTNDEIDGYSFVTDPVPTVAVQATLIASTDLDDAVAYHIVRSLIENQREVAEGHARGAYISPFNAVQSISVNLHPGALRFFEGLGILD